jgi:hypothetical protein
MKKERFRIWIRIRETQKHTDPADPDPVSDPDSQHWFKRYVHLQNLIKSIAFANIQHIHQIKVINNTAWLVYIKVQYFLTRKKIEGICFIYL